MNSSNKHFEEISGFISEGASKLFYASRSNRAAKTCQLFSDLTPERPSVRVRKEDFLSSSRILGAMFRTRITEQSGNPEKASPAIFAEITELRSKMLPHNQGDVSVKALERYEREMRSGNTTAINKGRESNLVSDLGAISCTIILQGIELIRFT